ncbi:MAG: hypothetical protein LBM27_04095 [Lactobacillaceae bacterium]|jgi:hypothetical protein|nr:hypothetical protein [Lactobacillaceae bacterium]
MGKILKREDPWMTPIDDIFIEPETDEEKARRESFLNGTTNGSDANNN